MAVRVTRRIGLTAIALVLATVPPGLRAARAQRPTTAPADSSMSGVRVEAISARADDLGDTYYHLESKAGRVTTRFAAGAGIAQREIDGSLSSQLLDSAGTQIATLRVSGSKMVVNKRGVIEEKATNLVRRTLDWVNVEITAQATGRAFEPTGIDAEFEGGLIATSVLQNSEIHTVISRYGTEVGRLKYLPKEQVLAWKFPGLTEGWVNPKRLEKVGGWKFKHTMAWANVQALAFYEFHTYAKAHPPGVQQEAILQSRPWFQRALDTVIAPLAANEPGCDYLHWLDNSILRPCCDRHDGCYARNSGCSAWSWWWSASWQCAACNWNVVTCFLSGGEWGGPYYQS